MQIDTEEILKEMNPNMLSLIKENQNTIDEYNCMGFVAAYFGWNKILTCEYSEDIEKYLADNTTEITRDEISKSDIIVYRDENNEIEHIGICVSARKETYIAKMGSLDLAIDEFVGIEFDYGYPTNYYRLN